MSGREEYQLIPRKRFSMKLKLTLGAVLTGFAVVAIVCFVVLYASNSASSTSTNSASIDRRRSVNLNSAPDTTVGKSRRNHQSSSRATRQVLSRDSSEGSHNPNYRHDMSCLTDLSNDTVPAAHIKSYGGAFKRPDGSTSEVRPIGFQQRWKCSDFDPNHHQNTHAFVDGGMIFNQTDQKLYVPTCGYYQVFSQIMFEKKAEGSSDKSHTTAFHLFKFERNCKSWEDGAPVTVMGRTSVHAGNTVTTHTGDIIKLCGGGTIWVEIPDTQESHPRGDENGTFFWAVLVAETTCHWPPKTTMDNLDSDD